MDDTTYVFNGKVYFSHSVNYAIQSGSIDVLRYIINKGYGVTVSNLITAIRQASFDVFEHVLLSLVHIGTSIPRYVLYYLSVVSYVPDKLMKLCALMKAGVNMNQNTIADYKLARIHMNLVREQRTIIAESAVYDSDTLLDNAMFFHDIPDKHYITLCLVRYYLYIQDYGAVKSLITKDNESVLMDGVLLYGDSNSIKRIYRPIEPPSMLLVLEIICRVCVYKVCYLIYNKLIRDMTVAVRLVRELNNDTLNILFLHLT